LKPFVPVCGITLCYETPNLPGPSWQKLFIVVERLPLPEGVSMDCNISIVFTGQIRKMLGAIMEARRQRWQQLLREATEMEGEMGGETRPNEEQVDVEDIDHGDWIIVEGSSYEQYEIRGNNDVYTCVGRLIKFRITAPINRR
jgi:hypothetical protein